MDWWIIITLIIITLIIAATLAYGYWDHNHQRRLLGKSFALLATKYGGEVKPGNVLVFPQLRFERDGRRYLVTAMATDGSDAGESGPFTFVEVDLPFDTGRKIRVKRSVGKRLMDALGPGGHPTTGHKEFDEAFRIEGSDQIFASSLLELRVREKLLGSRAPRLGVRVDRKKISVHRDGIAKSTAELQELIDIAGLLAGYCPTTP